MPRAAARRPDERLPKRFRLGENRSRTPLVGAGEPRKTSHEPAHFFPVHRARGVSRSPAWPQRPRAGALYRCPGNDYNNTISASEAEKLHCKKVENANVTVIRSRAGAWRRPARRAVPAAPAADAKMPAENAALRERASNVRRDLEGRLKQRGAQAFRARGGVQRRRARAAQRRDRLPDYLDRVANMRSAIARKQIEIAELRRELDKLPTR